MSTSEANEKARKSQIQNMMKLRSDRLKITQLSEGSYLVNAIVKTIYIDEGTEYFGNEVEFEITLPTEFPLLAKPTVCFPDNKKRPVSPNISSSGTACIGDWTNYSTLNKMIRKLLLESIFDGNTINVASAYKIPLNIYNKLLKNPNVSFPLMSPEIIYQWIPLIEGELKSEMQPAKRTAKLKG
jgi:ubiquitin-protein ligase